MPTDTKPPATILCVCHDIERGWGHVASDAAFAEAVDRSSRLALDAMLNAEREFSVNATYNVLGCFFEEVRSKIEGHGHALAFHSYDHVLEEPQLARCREVDARVKGYRPPQSKITDELTDANLLANDFEWFACSASTIETEVHRMENGIVKLPILFDDYSLYSEGRSFSDWEEYALRQIKGRPFVAFGLHDCYAQYWRPHYTGFLQKLRNLGTFKTLDEIAAEVMLGSGRHAG